jgi:metal-responsive CopG/Arc/MetJ family transcriptional regulator
MKYTYFWKGIIITTYRTVRIPEDLVQSSLKAMEIHKELGYRSHSEFIIDAVRRRVEQLMDPPQE